MEKLKPEFKRLLIILIVLTGVIGGAIGFFRGFSETSDVGVSLLFALAGGLIGVVPFLLVYIGI